MNKKDNKLVIFDLDNTLTKGSSWARLNIGMGMAKEEDTYLSEKYYQAEKFREWASIILRIYYERGKPKKEQIQNILNKFEYVAGAEKCVKKLKRMGYVLVLLSGAPDIFTELICKRLKVDYSKSMNRLIFDKNNFLVDILSEGEENQNKLDYCRQICESLRVDIKKAIVVGDGVNEELLFDASPYSITFKGSQLEKRAWKIVSHLDEIPGLISKL